MSVLGAALLTAAGLWAGVMAAARLRERARQCRGLCRMLSLMEFELARFQTPLPELFTLLAQRLGGTAAGLCADTAAGLARGGEPFGELWRAALAPVAGREREVLEPLGGVLGRYGVEEELAAVARAREQLEELAGALEMRARERGRVYIGVCTAGALILAVLLV